MWSSAIVRARGVATISIGIRFTVPAIWCSAVTDLIAAVGAESLRRSRGTVRFVLPLCFGGLVVGCTTHQLGPTRPITIEDDVAWMRSVSQPQPEDVARFRVADSTRQANMRNEVVTARMYIADMQYHLYESKLTKEIQEEGLAATLMSLGLTTSATLLSPAGTKTILSGLATAVTGADKAYNEKLLLSNAIQALQTQMRADRKEQASAIYAKMFKSSGNPTPIGEYTLPMALSDADAYYQAGTIASALIGLAKTVSAKETHADEAKASAGPNPAAVTAAKGIASPTTTTRTVVISNLSSRNASYRRLQGLLRPGEIAKYVEGLLGTPPVRAGALLNDGSYAHLYDKISECIVARTAGRPCDAESLQQFR